jgi:cytidyltransferase-like protein
MTPEQSIIEGGTRKIFSLEQVIIMVAEEKRRDKTVGLVTGCFDILHVGHINLFRSAKKHVDVLVVGVERDESLKSKGPDRPINKLQWRCEMLSELISVDLVFPIEFIIEYEPSVENDNLFGAMYERIKPNFLITNPATDNYWEQKAQRSKKMGMVFLGLEHERIISSTEIINKVQKDI